MATAAAAPPPEFRLDAESHRYFLGDSEIFGVTRVLRDAGLVDTTWYTEYGRNRGSAIHLAAQLNDEGDLDEASVAPEIAPYLVAWRAFVAESGFVAEEIEKPRVHPHLRYAGTPDRVGYLPGAAKARRCVVDLKRGANHPVYRLQTAAYANLLFEPMLYERLTVFLDELGRYRVKVHAMTDFPADIAVFRSALNIANFKRTYL